MKAPSPLLGFNNNVRHKGRVFHIQTEDSGVRHPHVITHLFADGGRILKTTKTSYAEHVGQERLAETVRAMMQEQHKAMFIALRDGQFDYLFEEGPASHVGPKPSNPGFVPNAAAAPPAAAPPVVAAPVMPPPLPPVPPPLPAPPPAVVVPAPSVAMLAPAPAVAVPPPLPVRAPSAPRPAPPPLPSPSVTAQATPAPADTSPASRRRPPTRPKLDVDPAAIHGVGGPPSIDRDLDALERAAAEAQIPFLQQIQDLPPPPATVLGQKRPSLGSAGGSAPGGYSVRGPGEAPASPAAPSGRQTSPRPMMTPAAPPAASARYAPSRPASIFATTRPQEGSSIFGEDLISEKSLDEVILGYLAEDLDGPGEKK
ncbi:Hypothetical protein A7982_11396 [Minicystis rosea]|nr:Hypothetical protein A7982_11396 [Minicystis rosea]